jgi:hypothetical protein
MHRDDDPVIVHRVLDLAPQPIARFDTAIQSAAGKNRDEIRPGGDLVQDDRIEFSTVDGFDVVKVSISLPCNSW